MTRSSGSDHPQQQALTEATEAGEASRGSGHCAEPYPFFCHTERYSRHGATTRGTSPVVCVMSLSRSLAPSIPPPRPPPPSSALDPVVIRRPRVPSLPSSRYIIPRLLLPCQVTPPAPFQAGFDPTDGASSSAPFCPQYSGRTVSPAWMRGTVPGCLSFTATSRRGSCLRRLTTGSRSPAPSAHGPGGPGRIPHRGDQPRRHWLGRLEHAVLEERWAGTTGPCSRWEEPAWFQ